MSERLHQDASPGDNQCMLVDQLITCTDCDDLNPEEIRAALDVLSPHIARCVACKENLALSQAFVVSLGRKETYLFTGSRTEGTRDQR